ncbi:MAG: Ig-like domain-containing protein [Nitrospirae bacterium]|nr:Ig-like domain-containing protein [Nitrospirota bacterium]
MSIGFQIRVWWAGITGLLAILMIAGGCARQTFQDLQSPATVRSLIKTQIPAPDATGVTLNSAIQVVFEKGMDPTTINNLSFYVEDGGGNKVAGNATYVTGSRTAQFTATTGFSYLTAYTATMTTAVKDPQGNPLTAPVVWSFTTEKIPLTIGANIRISDYTLASVPAGSYSSGQCSLAWSGGTLYAVWYDNRMDITSAHIYFTKSTDGGLTFGPNVKVDDDTTTTNHEYPCITLDSQGNVYVVWDDQRGGTDTGYDVYVAKSTDGGAIFGPSVKVNHDGTPYDQNTASIAVGADGTIYVAWKDYRTPILDSKGQPTNADIFASTSTDGGQTFSAEVKVNDNTVTALQSHPSIGVDSVGKIYLVWTDQRNLAVNGTNGDIYFSVGTFNGSIWSFGKNILINDDTVYANQHDPSLRIGPADEILIAWADHRNGGNSDIYFSKSTDGGATFSANLGVDLVFTGGQDVPSLAVNASGKIIVTWQNSIPTGVGKQALLDIKAATSTDEGASFHTGVLVNDDTNSAAQRQANVAIDDSGQVYMFWADDRNGVGSGNFDIYFAIGQ